MDAKSFLDSYDLVALIEQTTGKRLKWSGNQTWGIPCPKCNGDNRFNIKISNGRQLAFCRGCEIKAYDAAKLVQALGYAKDFKEALKYLGFSDNGNYRKPSKQPVKPKPAELESVKAPCAMWQQRATEFANKCHDMLLSPHGAKALEYLHKRGLNDDTIKKYRLGYHPRFEKFTGNDWGIDRDVSCVAGVTIPRFVLGEIYAVNIRRLNADATAYAGGDKYICATGSKPTALFNCDEINAKTIAVIATGGEFDAMLCQQFAPDGVACVSLGAEGFSLMPPFRAMVESVPSVRIAYDADSAGAKGALKWADLKTRVRRAKTPSCKDATEFFQHGGDLASWVAEIAGVQAMTPATIATATEPTPATVTPEPTPAPTPTMTNVVAAWLQKIDDISEVISAGNPSWISKREISDNDAAALSAKLPNGIKLIDVSASYYQVRIA